MGRAGVPMFWKRIENYVWIITIYNIKLENVLESFVKPLLCSIFLAENPDEGEKLSKNDTEIIGKDETSNHLGICNFCPM